MGKILMEQAEYEDHLQEVAERAVRGVQSTLEEMKRMRVAEIAARRGLVPQDWVCTFLGVSKRTLRNWGVPRHCRMGNTTFYDMDEVEAHIRKHGKPIPNDT